MNEDQAINLSLKLMEDSEVVYLTMIDSDGFPETRAMLNLRNTKIYPGLKEVFQHHNVDLLTYFTTNTSSPKIERVNKNPKVCAYYCKPDEWRGLMVSGFMEIVDDKNIKDELWQDNWTMYYPGGSEDMDYTVLCLRPTFLKGYHQFQQYGINIEGI